MSVSKDPYIDCRFAGVRRRLHGIAKEIHDHEFQFDGAPVHPERIGFDGRRRSAFGEKRRIGLAKMRRQMGKVDRFLGGLSFAGILANAVYDGAGALGVMSSYNRIGAVASSANKAVMVDIMRGEWGFKGYNVTDFTGVSLKAAPKESILFGTTNFCGFGNSVSYWSEDALRGDADMMQAIHDDMHYALYALSRSYAMDLNVNTHVEWLMTWYRATYISLITVFSVASLACVVGYVVCGIRGKNKKEAR